MASPENTRRLWSLGLFALPLIAVKLSAVMLGGSSQHAGAAAQPAPVDAVDPVTAATPGVSRIEWSAEQQAAAAHVTELAMAPFGPSPIVYMKPAEQPTPVTEAPEPEPVIEMAEPQPTFVLHAVMVAPNANKALINGRLYESGQRIDKSPWVVGEVNVDERTVTLHNDETRELIVISVQRPR